MPATTLLIVPVPLYGVVPPAAATTTDVVPPNTVIVPGVAVTCSKSGWAVFTIEVIVELIASFTVK